MNANRNMDISVSTVDNVIVLQLQGDLIGENSGAAIIGIVSDEMNEKVTACAINLSDIRYMNSSGLGVLITLLTKFKNKGGKVTLINPSDQIEKLLQITRLNEVFSIAESEEEAINELKR